MVLKLKPENYTRERILAYGGPGSGKTYGAFKIAEKLEGDVYFIEIDPTLDEYEESGEFDEVFKRTQVYKVRSFPDLVNAMDRIEGQTKPDDLIIVDDAGSPWTMARDYFVSVSKDQDSLADQLDSFNTSGTFGSIEYGDWGDVKKLYRMFSNTILMEDAHLYLTAPMKELVEAGSITPSQTIQRAYGAIGAKPAGEKTLGHMVRTVLFLQGSNPKTWRMTKVKDRQRDKDWGNKQTRKLGDLGKEYLVRIAGWRPA